MMRELTERATERFFEYLEDEENKKKKAKTEEAIGWSNQAAVPSSGWGGVGRQRSRGGVPPLPDAGGER